MVFDSVILAAVVAELNKTLLNGRVDKIQQPTPLDVVLTVRSNHANYFLLLSAEPQSPRLHLTSVKRPNPQTPPNFCMLMRKYLDGSRFLGAEQVGFDRIVHLRFSAYDGERFRLVIEVMGKHSNVILINSEDRILGVAKPIGRTKNRYREVLPGRQYVAPPAQDKLNPLEVSGEEFDSIYLESFPDGQIPDQEALASWLVRRFSGVSPFLSRELAARGEGDPVILRDEFESLFGDIRAANFLPVLISDGAGRTIGYYAFPSVQYPPDNQHERTSMSTVADIFYTTVLPREAFAQAQADFIGRVRRELESRERTIGFMRESIAECEDADRYKQLGELILSQVASIPESAESVEIVDYYDPNGATIRVSLDPKLSGPENAEAYFRRYHKAVSGAEALRDRLAESERELDVLRGILEDAESATSEEDIHELQSALDSQGLHLRKQEESTTEKRKVEFDGFRVSRLLSGNWEILVGQNSDANDYLLTRIAKPNDIWVHVKASPSAHVIIRTNGKPETVPQTVLYAAAEQAARHSDAKHSSLVPVDYTLRKHVRKPKGAPAGKAIYTHEKTIYLTPGAD